MEGGLDAAATTKLSAWTFPNGCHIAEVEVDPDTGTVKVVDYNIVDDFGVVLNPMLVEGQVHGGIVQGIGQALLEGAVYDDSGQLLTGSFMDYTMPRADNMPSFDFSTVEVPCKNNTMGVKGCGEAGLGGSTRRRDQCPGRCALAAMGSIMSTCRRRRRRSGAWRSDRHGGLKLRRRRKGEEPAASLAVGLTDMRLCSSFRPLPRANLAPARGGHFLTRRDRASTIAEGGPARTIFAVYASARYMVASNRMGNGGAHDGLSRGRRGTVAGIACLRAGAQPAAIMPWPTIWSRTPWCDALQAQEQYQPGTNLEAWLFTILRNRFRSLRSRSHVSAEIGMDDLGRWRRWRRRRSRGWR